MKHWAVSLQRRAICYMRRYTTLQERHQQKVKKNEHHLSDVSLTQIISFTCLITFVKCLFNYKSKE